MEYSGVFKVDDKEFQILYASMEAHQTVDDEANITSPKQFAHVYLELLFTPDEMLPSWASEPESPKDASVELAVEFADESGSGILKTINLKNAYCVQFEEKYDYGRDTGLSLFRTGAHNFITCITLTASEIAVNDTKLPNF